jgi:hypothetical protein
MSVWYARREDVKSALDIKQTARADAQVDRAIGAASRTIENVCNRVFYPTRATRYFNWPSEQTRTTTPWRLWLDENEVISVIALSSGGVTIPATDYFLEPNEAGPPYDRIELDLADNSTFGQNNTYQHDIALEAVYGYDDNTTPAGTLVSSISASATSLAVTDGTIGVGDLLTIDSEKLIVTGKAWLSTTDTSDNVLGESMADDVVTPSGDPTNYAEGEVIAIGSEKMLVVEIMPAYLVVKRAWDGSTLAAHAASAPVLAKRTLQVQRGQLGTQAVGHLDTAGIGRQVFAEGVTSLCVALALDQVLQEGSGYSRETGSGDNARPATGAGLAAAVQRAYETCGRKARMKAV